MREQPMICWTCRRNRAYPMDFPVLIFAKCYLCYPMSERIKAQEWQVPPAFRFWRTDLSRG